MHFCSRNANYSTPMLAYRNNIRRWSVTHTHVCADQTQVEVPCKMFGKKEEQDGND